MKAFLPLLLSFFFIISCQQHKEATISPIDEEDELQEEADSLPRATAIFWLDKYHMKELKKDDVLTFRTAKAKVIIRNDGTIELLSFVEQQSGNAQRYIRYRLKDFKVKKILMDNGYIIRVNNTSNSVIYLHLQGALNSDFYYVSFGIKNSTFKIAVSGGSWLTLDNKTILTELFCEFQYSFFATDRKGKMS